MFPARRSLLTKQMFRWTRQQRAAQVAPLKAKEVVWCWNECWTTKMFVFPYLSTVENASILVIGERRSSGRSKCFTRWWWTSVISRAENGCENGAVGRQCVLHWLSWNWQISCVAANRRHAACWNNLRHRCHRYVPCFVFGGWWCIVRVFRTVNRKSSTHPSIECRVLSKSRIYGIEYHYFLWFKSIASKRLTTIFSHYCIDI